MFGRISRSSNVISITLDRRKVRDTLTFLPGMFILMAGVLWIISNNLTPSSAMSTGIAEQTSTPEPTPAALKMYPQQGSELNSALFSIRLPPAPLDALPYDVQEPLSNGTSVPVKKRWLWIPEGQTIEITKNSDGQIHVAVPIGAMWWKEFYLQTDRGTSLIERRIIVRVRESKNSPDGWAYYSAHYLPQEVNSDTPLVLSWSSEEASRYEFAPNDWIPTQLTSQTVEVRFEDVRGIEYPYVFPGQAMCSTCHAGASGAYPNMTNEPIEVFGFHPNNLTPKSLEAIVKRGWIKGSELLLTAGYLSAAEPVPTNVSLEEATTHLVGVIRNNCASCHNSSANAPANFTAFIVDPNRDYTSSELVTLLGQNGRMMLNANPLVTPGQLEMSEIWLRINGLDGRRRMPPREGGLPEVDPKVIQAWKTWILLAGNQ